MNVEIGAEAALFPEKEYISGIFVSVQSNFLLLQALLPVMLGVMGLHPLCEAASGLLLWPPGGSLRLSYPFPSYTDKKG